MPRIITISLPVVDLERSKKFYGALGFTLNAQFCSDGMAFFVCSDTINVVLLTHEKWKTRTTRSIPPTTASEVGLNISCNSREEVDAMNHAAGKHGGVADINPVEDQEFMYGRDFTDPDGHVWGAFWMDMSAIPSNP